MDEGTATPRRSSRMVSGTGVGTWNVTFPLAVARVAREEEEVGRRGLEVGNNNGALENLDQKLRRYPLLATKSPEGRINKLSVICRKKMSNLLEPKIGRRR